MAAFLLLCAALFAQEPLVPQALDPGLSVIEAHDALGLGAEAARAKAWLGTGGTTVLFSDRLEAGGRSFGLTRELARALGRLNGYFAMTPRTLERPIALDELRAAFTSPAGIEAVRTLFDGMIGEAIRIRGRLVVAEVGGEASLDGQARLVQARDPLRPHYREIARLRDDAKALKEYVDRAPGIREIDDFNLLKRALDTWAEWEAKGKPGAREKFLDLTINTVLENSASTFTYDPKSQIEMILSHDWPGRYIGLWHTHPPHDTGTGFASSGESEPSCPDMAIAAESGQNLVLRFQEDGFDVFDLSALAGRNKDQACDLSQVKSFSHRSEAWRWHFQRRHRELLTGK